MLPNRDVNRALDIVVTRIQVTPTIVGVVSPVCNPVVRSGYRCIAASARRRRDLAETENYPLLTPDSSGEWQVGSENLREPRAYL